MECLPVILHSQYHNRCLFWIGVFCTIRPSYRTACLYLQDVAVFIQSMFPSGVDIDQNYPSLGTNGWRQFYKDDVEKHFNFSYRMVYS